jgi:plastocyanin
MTMKRIRWIGGLAVVAALVMALGACGSDDDEGGGSGGGAGAQQEESSSGGGGSGAGGGGGSGGGSTVQVSATEFKFDPANPKVKAGKVKFEMTNDGQAPHALEIEGEGVEEETDTIDGGESTTLTVELAEGTYRIYCPVGDHEERGMVGTLTVGAAAPSSGGTTTDDDGDGETHTDETHTGETETGETETGDDDGSGGSGSGY